MQFEKKKPQISITCDNVFLLRYLTMKPAEFQLNFQLFWLNVAKKQSHSAFVFFCLQAKTEIDKWAELSDFNKNF